MCARLAPELALPQTEKDLVRTILEVPEIRDALDGGERLFFGICFGF